ncbi:MAG: T9SS type A sorting domain-containing protein [Bacteroidia bacterium]|nr:T9SS type A sorting domain-containing protein [Bacteroidia bacterium]
MKLKINVLGIISILLSFQIYAQQSCVWNTLLSSKKNDKINRIKIINNQHLLICGSVEDTAQINGNAVFNCTAPSGIIAELDNSHNLMFSKVFQNITSSSSPLYYSSFSDCKDVLKDNAGNYYVAINFSGDVLLDTVSLNAENGMIIAKLNPSGKLVWYYTLENTVPTALLLNNNTLSVLAFSPIYLGYTPSQLILLNLNSTNGSIKKYLIGNNSFKDITSHQMIFQNNRYLLSCTFSDSIVFNNHTKIVSLGKSSAIIQLDTNFNILNFTSFTGKDNKSNIINDIEMDNTGNVYAIGTYNSNNLYIKDTIRLTKSTIASRMFLVQLNSNLQVKWTKQEAQNPSNNASFGIREGYAITIDNSTNTIYTLSYLFNSVILSIDTLFSNSLLLSKYTFNEQYLLSEKIAGSPSKVYDLIFNNSHLYAAVPFTNTITICQNTIVSSGLQDVYIVELDKLTNLPTTLYPNSEIFIYPNPADDKVSFSSMLTFYQYKIFDISGREVDAGFINNNSIFTQHLNNGIYLIQLFNDKIVASFKLIIQH